MRRWLIGGFAVLFLIWLFGVIIGPQPEPVARPQSPTVIPTRQPTISPTVAPRPAATATPLGPSIGEEAHLDASGLDQWHLTVDDKAQSEWVSAQVARDTIGLNQMIRAGRAFPVANGTRLLVLDQNPFTTRVRVLEGPHAGRVGVVNTEHVIR